jgi:hypothetical protein
MTGRTIPRPRLIPALLVAFALTLTVSVRPAAAACGDGVVDAGEQCDDTAGCCTPECTFVTKGSACPDEGELCTRDVCDGVGACLHDGSPLDSCLVAPKGKLQIVDDADDSKDKLNLQMMNAPGVTPEDFGNPMSSDAYHACIFGPDRLLMEAEVTPGGTWDGKPCWAETTTGFTYKDKTGSRDGITALRLKASAKPKTKIAAKGQGAALDDPTLPFPNAVMAQIVNAQNGQCFETYFLEQSAVKKNSSTHYDAMAAAPGFEVPGLSTVIRQDDLSPFVPTSRGTSGGPRLPPLGPDPTEIYVQAITYDGSGCPPETVDVSLNPERTEFTLAFDQFAATKGPGVPPSEALKQCQVTLDLKVPQGWQYSVATIEYRGSMQLPRKMKAEQRTTYYFEGDGELASAESLFKGPVTRDYLIRDTLPYSTVVWSSCDKVRPLTITTELELLGGTTAGGITTDTMDGRNASVLELRWQECP